MVLTRWRWYHWLFGCLTCMAVISASAVFAYLVGAGLWLESLPVSFWLALAGMSLGTGLIIGGLAVLQMERNLVRHIYQAARLNSPLVETALARILLMLAAGRGQDGDKARRHMAYSILTLTEQPIWDNTCKFCGAENRFLQDHPYDPKLHRGHCPVPYARHIAGQELGTKVPGEKRVATR